MAKESLKLLPISQKAVSRVHSRSEIMRMDMASQCFPVLTNVCCTERENHTVRDTELKGHCLSSCFKLGMLGTQELQPTRSPPYHHIQSSVLCTSCFTGLNIDGNETHPATDYNSTARGNGQEEPCLQNLWAQASCFLDGKTKIPKGSHPNLCLWRHDRQPGSPPPGELSPHMLPPVW